MKIIIKSNYKNIIVLPLEMEWIIPDDIIFLFHFVAHSFFLKHTNLVGKDNDDPGVELENREE